MHLLNYCRKNTHIENSLGSKRQEENFKLLIKQVFAEAEGGSQRCEVFRKWGVVGGPMGGSLSDGSHQSALRRGGCSLTLLQGTLLRQHEETC